MQKGAIGIIRSLINSSAFTALPKSKAAAGLKFFKSNEMLFNILEELKNATHTKANVARIYL